MTKILRNVSTIAPRTFFEDALGLAAICIIIFAGFSLPALT